MKPQPFPNSPNYRAVVRGFLQLHRLDLAGKNTSPEADIVRDSMDAPWLELSEVERERLTGLSEDLYSLTDITSVDGPKTGSDNTQRQIVEVLEASERGEWDRALVQLRSIKEYVAPDLLSFLRGHIWFGAGDPEVAAVFLKHAATLAPTNGRYQGDYLCALEKTDPSSALELAKEIIAREEHYSPDPITYAADTVFKAARRSGDPVEALSTSRTLIPVLERTLKRLEAEEKGAERTTTKQALMILAFCHALLGDTAKELDYLSRGVQLFPEETEFLVTRGLVLYGISPRAIADLELAIENGFREVWPYMFLAHHYLLNNRFDECRVMCEHALRMKLSDIVRNLVRSELLTWLAISQAELGFPVELVVATFEQAIRTDPTNEEATRNFAIFQTAISTRSARKSEWQRRSESAVRSSSQRLISDERVGRSPALELSTMS